MREDNTPVEELSPASLALGGAAVGAGFGGLIGAVVGWIMGAQVTATPQIGPVVGQWVLPSTLVGLLAGVAVGALIGALAAISSVRQKPQARQAKAIVPARLNDKVSIPAIEEPEVPALADDHADLVAASSLGATEIASDETEPVPATQTTEIGDDGPREASPTLKAISRRRRRINQTMSIAETSPAPDIPSGEPENDGPVHASTLSVETPSQDASDVAMEATNVNDEQKGRNPNTFTGTEAAVDPETGAVGTAGTPVTTGYGVSGSTIGTGSRRRQKKQENPDFRGATTDTRSYDRGGRSSIDFEPAEGIGARFIGSGPQLGRRPCGSKHPSRG